MKHIVLLDVETSGTDVATSHVVELAICRYSVPHATPLWSYATVVRSPSNEAFEVNGIPPDVLASAQSFESACKPLRNVLEHSDAVVGWNAPGFDRLFFPPDIQEARPWIDLMDDVIWPRQSTSKSLTAMALALGCAIADAHRALSDVTLMARMLSRAKELGADLDSMLARGLRPKGLFEVADKRFDEERNRLAKEAGFRWDQATRSWRRSLAIEDASSLPFEVRRVDSEAA